MTDARQSNKSREMLLDPGEKAEAVPTPVACSLQGLLRHFQRPLQRGVRLDDPVVPHDRKTELGTRTSMVSELVLALVPLFPDAQGVLAPRACVDDGFGKDLDALEGVGHRSEHGRNAFLALLRVYSIAVGKPFVGWPECVETAEGTWNPQRSVSVLSVIEYELSGSSPDRGRRRVWTGGTGAEMADGD